MAKIIYNKLIRDRIPEIIEKDGKRCKVETMPPDEYKKALLEKLVEETQEVQNADVAHIKTELADILEVIDGILIQQGLSNLHDLPRPARAAPWLRRFPTASSHAGDMRRMCRRRCGRGQITAGFCSRLLENREGTQKEEIWIISHFLQLGD